MTPSFSRIVGAAALCWIGSAGTATAQAGPGTGAPAEEPPGIDWGVAFQFYTIDHVGTSPAAAGFPLGWNRILILPSGLVNPELGFRGRFAIDNFGVSAAGLGSGHLRSSALDVGSPFYIDWAYASFRPGDAAWHFGIMNLIQEVKVGSTRANPFDASAVYSIAMTRFGGVGTPPLRPDGALDAAAVRVGLWHMGTNVALETLDPNSTFANFPAPALTLAHQRPLGEGRLTIATMDGTYGANLTRARDPAQARALYLPLNFPEPAPYHQGYSLALYDRPLGWGRLQLGVRADNNTLAGPTGKYSAVTLDVGGTGLAGSLTLAGAGAPVDRFGGWVWHPDVAGFGVGLGVKAGGIGPLRRDPFPFVSLGPAVRLPARAWLPPITLSAQQTAGEDGRALAAGLTVETSLELHPALPAIHAEYSLGKLDPGGANALLDPSRPFTHQLYSVLTTFGF